MNKPQNQETVERELRDTIEIGNKIVSFYEEVLEAQTERIEALEKQNANLSRLVRESKELLKVPSNIETNTLTNEQLRNLGIR